MHPECEAAIDDIINEAIVSDEERQVDIILDDVQSFRMPSRKKIRDEFKFLLKNA